MNLNFKLTNNFTLGEFIMSSFFDEKSQARVIKEFRQNIELHFNIQKLACNLQVIREEFATPVKINIAFRPVFWEHKQERSGDSKHTLGIAADIIVDGYDPKEVADKIEELINYGSILEGGVGRYNTFTHYDIRGTKARWDETN